LPSFTETSLVNLALASGLMAHALGIRKGDVGLAPATGQSTFSFKFRPREKIELTWPHLRGQVEIDSLFTARRNGKETVFIMESKAGREFDSLSNHKLVYPVLALPQKVPRYMHQVWAQFATHVIQTLLSNTWSNLAEVFQQTARETFVLSHGRAAVDHGFALIMVSEPACPMTSGLISVLHGSRSRANMPSVPEDPPSRISH